MKMPRHMGQVRRTAQNLEVVQVREADNVLLIRAQSLGRTELRDYSRVEKRPKGWTPPSAKEAARRAGQKK
jgi:hypothetical protein